MAGLEENLSRRAMLRWLASGAVLSVMPPLSVPDLAPALPLTPPVPVPAEPVAPLLFDAAAFTTTHPILITYRDEDCLSLFKLMLERAGYSVIGVTDISEWQRLCREVPVSLLISDIIHIGMSGYQLIKWVRAHPATRMLPYLVFETYCMARAQVDAYLCGASGFLSLPAMPPEVTNMVAEHLQVWADGVPREPVVTGLFNPDYPAPF
ncbi:MAG: response regulator [Anaerolineae bacterium]|nr:response regulator [Anaerolineae bacterium]